MPRIPRTALGIALLLATLAVGGALGYNPDSPNAERVVELLDDAGVTTDATELDDLADVYGLGGAVRILAFAEAAEVDPSDIMAMRDGGMGWGQIMRALADEDPNFDLTPGIGWIMSGHGQGHGQGQVHGQGHGHGQGGGGTDAD